MGSTQVVEPTPGYSGVLGLLKTRRAESNILKPSGLSTLDIVRSGALVRQTRVVVAGDFTQVYHASS